MTLQDYKDALGAILKASQQTNGARDTNPIRIAGEEAAINLAAQVLYDLHRIANGLSTEQALGLLRTASKK